MTVVDESADCIRVAKIHAQFNAGILKVPTVVIRHVDGVAEKGLVYRNSGPVEHHEMNLMDVERVQFGGAILDDPILDVALLHYDVGNTRGRVKGRGCLAVHGDEKSSGAVGVVWVEKFFGEVQLARAHRRDAS